MLTACGGSSPRTPSRKTCSGSSSGGGPPRTTTVIWTAIAEGGCRGGPGAELVAGRLQGALRPAPEPGRRVAPTGPAVAPEQSDIPERDREDLTHPEPGEWVGGHPERIIVPQSVAILDRRFPSSPTRRRGRDESGDRLGREAGQFLGLQLVQPAAVDPSFTDEVVGIEPLEQGEDDRAQGGRLDQGRLGAAPLG